MSSWDSPLLDEGSRGNASSWGSPPLNFDEGSRGNASSWGSPPLNFHEGSRGNASSWGSLPLNFGEGRRTLWDSLSGENGTSSSQIGSNTAPPNGWWTGGANGLQMAGTESFEVEEVPYSSNPKETLRMVLLLAIGAQLIWGSIIK